MTDRELYLVKRAYATKQAEEIPFSGSLTPKRMPWPVRYANNVSLGLLLDMGFNGGHVDSIANANHPTGTMHTPTLLSRGRQALSIASPIVGLVGGGMLSDKATRWLNKKLGLTRDKGRLRGFAGNALRAVNTFGGASVGGLAGLGLAGLLAGNPKATNDLYDRALAKSFEDPKEFVNAYLSQVKPL